MKFEVRAGDGGDRRGGRPTARPPTILVTCVAVWALLLCANARVMGQSADSPSDPRKEYNVKGAYLYSIGRYATWPAHVFANEQQSFVIGVFGESPIIPVLQHIQQSKKINNRPIQVREVKNHDEIPGCHMLFLSGSLEAAAQRLVIQHHSRSHVLLIGETMGFAHWGGVVNFYLADGSVRFEINVDAARRQEITVDAKLLRIATLVSDTTVGNRSPGEMSP